MSLQDDYSINKEISSTFRFVGSVIAVAIWLLGTMYFVSSSEGVYEVIISTLGSLLSVKPMVDMVFSEYRRLKNEM